MPNGPNPIPAARLPSNRSAQRTGRTPENHFASAAFPTFILLGELMKVPVRAFIRGNFWAGPAFAAHSSAEENRRHRFLQRERASRELQIAFFHREIHHFARTGKTFPDANQQRLPAATPTPLVAGFSNWGNNVQFNLSVSRESRLRLLRLPFISRKIRARHLGLMLLPLLFICLPTRHSSSLPFTKRDGKEDNDRDDCARSRSSSCRRTN